MTTSNKMPDTSTDPEPTLIFETWEQLQRQTLSKVTIVRLKASLRHHGVKFKANCKKMDMFNILFQHLYESSHTCIDAAVEAAKRIQTCYRAWKVRHRVHTQGLAVLDRSKCNNEVDPITMEELKDVPLNQLFCFRDVDGKDYGFDVKPFWSWVQSGNDYNPFTRNLMTESTKNRLQKCWVACQIYDSEPQQVERRQDVWTTTEKAFDLFHSIYLLTGNFVDESWFLQLDRINLMRMYRFLHDIWVCQIDMPMEERLRFSPVNSPVMAHLYDVCFRRKYNFKKLQEVLLADFDRMLTNPEDKQDKCTAAIWILVSLTMVSNTAAYSLPHLVQTYY